LILRNLIAAGPRSLRWRIAVWYTVLLLATIAVVGIVLGIEARRIVLDGARASTDRVGGDIARIASSNGPIDALGEVLPIDQELALPGNLERWSSPSTFIEIDNRDGYPIAKSSNMGAVTFSRASTPERGKLYTVDETPLGPLLVRGERIATGKGAAMIVKVGVRLDLFYATLDRLRTLLGIVLVVAAIAVVIASFALASSAIKPIDELARKVGEIGADRLDRRVAWPERDDEVGRLARSFDAMLARLEESFARERRFISDASHEIKTPLTVINSNAQMLERWADQDPALRSESLRAIVAESASLATMVNGMLTLAKAESGDGIPREPVALEEIVTDAVRAAHGRAEAKGLALSAENRIPGSHAVVIGDANLLRQAVTNLIDNALKFTERGGVTVTLGTEGGSAAIDVADTGIGIEEAALSRVFDRFYRADESHSRLVEGQGLGLAIVRSIVRVHGGTVEAHRRAEGGSRFSIVLPLVAEPSSSAAHDSRDVSE
jgi:signal transduction histidine kinase